MPSLQHCLICGNSEDEVEKMHYFPINLERSRLWQEKMGMKYTSVPLRNYRICNMHFLPENYEPGSNWKLRRNAFPSLRPCRTGVTLTDLPPTLGQFMEQSEQPATSLETFAIPDLPRPPHELSSRQPGSLALQPGPSTDTRKSVFRGIKNLSKVDATPRKLRLIKMVESKEAHIRKLKKMSKRRAHDVKALCQLSDETVVRRLFDGMSSNTTDFLISQLRCAKRNPKGRRWTSQEKVVALALLKKSPRCYALLRKIVALPSKKTVLSLLEKIHFTPGINRHLFLHLKDFLDNDQDRCCALLFDEMDIMENIQYDQKGDCIVGYEDFGPEGPNSMTIAKKALLFMLVGLGEKKWKQPVAYYFSEKGCPAAILQMCIRNVIAAAQDLAQLDVVTTVCDMGSINIRTLKEMGCSVARPYFMVGDKKIFTMCDPPHLLKCTASLFRKHNIELPVEVLGNQVMEARFNDVRKAYEIDKNTPLVFRHLHKLRDEHLAPKMAYAMKVSIAGQIMSQSVASFLYTCTTAGELEQRAIATATFVQQVDSLFDSFNGRNTRREGSQECGKVLKYIITENSAHHEYWPKAFDMVKGWKYKRLTKTGRLNESKPPSQLGWLWSIKAIQSIWNYLHNVRNFKSLSPRRLNQDPAENTFGCIRGGCGSGDNPTALQFAANLKTQILNDLVHKPAKSNCEEDDSTLLSNLFAFISQGDSSSNSDVPETLAEPLPNETATFSHERMAEEIALAVHKGALATLSVAYVSGSIVRRLLSVVQDCESCKSALLSSELDPHNLFISFKEWSDLNKLCYPTESVVTAVGLSITILEQVLKEHKRNLSSIITDTISRKVSFSFLTCEIHTADITKLIIKSIIKIGIPWFCKRMNRSLKDVRSAKRKLKTFTHS